MECEELSDAAKDGCGVYMQQITQERGEPESRRSLKLVVCSRTR